MSFETGTDPGTTNDSLPQHVGLELPSAIGDVVRQIDHDRQDSILESTVREAVSSILSESYDVGEKYRMHVGHYHDMLMERLLAGRKIEGKKVHDTLIEKGSSRPLPLREDWIDIDKTRDFDETENCYRTWLSGRVLSQTDPTFGLGGFIALIEMDRVKGELGAFSWSKRMKGQYDIVSDYWPKSTDSTISRVSFYIPNDPEARLEEADIGKCQFAYGYCQGSAYDAGSRAQIGFIQNLFTRLGLDAPIITSSPFSRPFLVIHLMAALLKDAAGSETLVEMVTRHRQEFDRITAEFIAQELSESQKALNELIARQNAVLQHLS